MTRMHAHIAFLLVWAVFSLLTHIGVYHGQDAIGGHAQEQGHGHADSEICIVGLAHAHSATGHYLPDILLVRVAMLPFGGVDSYISKTRFKPSGRAPPTADEIILV